MSQPHKLSDYSEFLPKKDTRSPLPITNLPVNAISQEADPTLEIRTLIEQLQQTAREARNRARAVEEERDGLLGELARSSQQIEALRATEYELRSHFVEVTTIIAERDAALVEAERRGHSLSEALKKHEATVRERNDAQRQRDEAFRQRDETSRKFESFTRSSEESARLVAETQKQILAIRQARDTAHGQILELNNKLGRTEDELAELGYQHEAAQKAAKQAAQECADFRRQLDVVTTDRDATARQVEQVTQELDEQRKKYLDLAQEKSAALQSDSEHAAALTEIRTQVESFAQERDVARSRAQELARELDEVRGQFQTFRDEEAKNSERALAEAHEKLTTLETQSRESRHEAKNLRQRLDALNEQLSSVQTAAQDASGQRDEINQQLTVFAQERDAALGTLQTAQEQLDEVIRDRDQLRQTASDNAVELEAQVTALQAQAATFESTMEEAASNKERLTELNRRFEKQRVETIDLAAQLQGAQREIRELSASLAEARLQAKFAQAASRASKDGRTKSDFASLLPTPPAPAAPPASEETFTAPGSLFPADLPPIVEGDAAPAPVAVSQPSGSEGLSEQDIKSALGAMRHCFQSFTKTPTDLSLLNELHCHVQGFSERARVGGLPALHRLCAAFTDLTRGLYEIPEQINPSTLRTVHQTIEFLGALVKEKNLAQVKDPAKAVIYAVDDDLGNCESIALAMEESSMRTTYAQEPVIALSELAGARYDLIFLDVNLPGIDGFDLCRQIRGLAVHATTPIVFLTGLATLENRVQSSLCGGNDFIAKPFNMHELSVKAITLILKSQLQMA